MTDIIELKGYDTEMDKNTRTIHFYAIPKKGERIEMPPCFSSRYNDDHLAITLAHLERPELFELEEEDVYVPLNTTGRGDTFVRRK